MSKKQVWFFVDDSKGNSEGNADNPHLLLMRSLDRIDENLDRFVTNHLSNQRRAHEWHATERKGLPFEKGYGRTFDKIKKSNPKSEPLFKSQPDLSICSLRKYSQLTNP